MADYVATQAERETDAALRHELLAVAEAHRHHGESLEQIPCHENDELPANVAELRRTVQQADRELRESDPVTMVIRKQEAAAQFYIALAGMVRIHAARDVLRDLASEEIALSQRLCEVANHRTESQKIG